MTSTQFRQALSDLGLSQSEAARFLGVHINTAHGWARRDVPIPHATALLLRVMVERGNLANGAIVTVRSQLHPQKR